MRRNPTGSGTPDDRLGRSGAIGAGRRRRGGGGAVGVGDRRRGRGRDGGAGGEKRRRRFRAQEAQRPDVQLDQGPADHQIQRQIVQEQGGRQSRQRPGNQ